MHACPDPAGEHREYTLGCAAYSDELLKLELCAEVGDGMKG